MKEKTINIFSGVLRILLTVSIIVSGLCLIYGCLSIYYSGNEPYSPDAVKLAFEKIAVPVYICLGLLVLSVIFNLLFSIDNKKVKINPSNKSKCKILLTKKDFNKLTAEENSILKKEKNTRIIVKSIEIFIIVLLSVIFLMYSFNGSNFDSKDINGSVINAMKVMVPCLVLMLIISVVSYILCEQSYNRTYSVLVKLPKNTETKEHKKISPTLLIIRCVILILVLSFLIYGFATGGIADVLTKAVNICTECIGLG